MFRRRPAPLVLALALGVFAPIAAAQPAPAAAAEETVGRDAREMDALLAYLQVLGTMVDFKTYKASDPENLR